MEANRALRAHSLVRIGLGGYRPLAFQQAPYLISSGRKMGKVPHKVKHDKRLSAKDAKPRKLEGRPLVVLIHICGSYWQILTTENTDEIL